MSRQRIFIGLSAMAFILIIVTMATSYDYRYKCSHWINSNPLDSKAVHIALSCCGERHHEAAVMLKSAVLLTRTQLVFHIFTEHELQQYFIKKIDRLKQSVPGVKLCYRFYDMHFPSWSSATWRSLFAPCASQKLFMHESAMRDDSNSMSQYKNILTDIENVLYVDTDVLFLSPPEHTWSLFSRFNSTQIAAMAPEQLTGGGGWYDQFNDTLHYGRHGVNSGVLLLKLTQLRSKPWDDDLVTFLKRYKEQVRLGDQDLLNIYFHFHPERLYLAPCEYNYRSDFCAGNLTCKSAAKVLHGNRQLWQFPECNPFRAVFRAIQVHWDTNALPYLVCTNIGQSVKVGCSWSNMFVEELFKRFIPDFKVNGTICR